MNLSIAFAYILASTNPGRYAVPNDGLDDGPAFRTALTRACATDHLLKIPAGTFEISQESGKLGGLNVTSCAGLSIVGEGRSATKLRMVPRPMSVGEDYYLVNIDGGSSDIEITMLTLDGRRAEFEATKSTAEQVHLIRTYQAKRVDVHDADLINSVGAGIKAIDLNDISVSNVRFHGHGRGGFEAHSNTTDVRLVGNSFADIADQHIAQEGGGGNSRWSIVANNHGPHGTGSGLVYDLGSGATDLAMIGNTIVDGGVQGYSLDRFAVIGNVFDQSEVSGGTPLYFKGGNHQGAILGNVLRSEGSVGEAYALRVASLDNARDPYSLAIVGNVATHAANTGFHLVSGLGRITIDANVISSTQDATSYGIAISNLLNKDQRSITVSDNSITNEDTGVVVSVGSCATCTQDSIAINGNTVHSTKPGARGFYNETHTHLGIPYPSMCRGDGNVMDVLGLTWAKVGTANPQPNEVEGCTLYGEAVP